MRNKHLSQEQNLAEKKKNNNKYKAIVLKTIVRQSFPSDEWIIDFFDLLIWKKEGGVFVCLFVFVWGLYYYVTGEVSCLVWKVFLLF